jgi:hypothetical protein
MLQRIASSLTAFHHNEIGADEGMNKLLIFAMVALPLLALLILFGGQVVDFANEQWGKVFGGGGVPISR